MPRDRALPSCQGTLAAASQGTTSSEHWSGGPLASHSEAGRRPGASLSTHCTAQMGGESQPVEKGWNPIPAPQFLRPAPEGRAQISSFESLG